MKTTSAQRGEKKLVLFWDDLRASTAQGEQPTGNKSRLDTGAAGARWDWKGTYNGGDDVCYGAKKR
jgi:hypothetical protein